MPITNETLRQVMRYYLDHFNSGSATITDQTVHDTVLTSGGGGLIDTKGLYEGSVRYTLSVSGGGKPDWPDEWMPMTVEELAAELIAPEAAIAGGTRGGSRTSTRKAGGRAARAAKTARKVGAPTWLKTMIAPGASAKRTSRRGGGK